MNEKLVEMDLNLVQNGCIDFDAKLSNAILIVNIKVGIKHNSIIRKTIDCESKKIVQIWHVCH